VSASLIPNPLPAVLPAVVHGPGFGVDGVDVASIGGVAGRVPAVFVGVHMPHWLAHMRHPAMVSRSRLGYGKRRSPWPRSAVPWALDSGAYLEVVRHGRWRFTSAQWAEEVRQHAGQLGTPMFVAALDWVCAPAATDRSGKSVSWHIAATVDSYCELAALLNGPTDPYVLPTLQGSDPRQYEESLFRFFDAGVDVCRLPLVGVGSLAGRRDPLDVLWRVATVAEFGVGNIHAFGVHGVGRLGAVAHRVVSCDSMNWSLVGRKLLKAASCTHGGSQENNCAVWMEQWADHVCADLAASVHRSSAAAAWVAEVCRRRAAGGVDADAPWTDAEVASLEDWFADVSPAGGSVPPVRERWRRRDPLAS
jgi:hypothetical protein